MTIRTWSYELADLAVAPETVERAMRHDPSSASGPFSDLAREVLSEAATRCRIRGGCVVVDDPVFDRSERSVRVAGDTFHVRSIVFGQIRRAERLAHFVCTAGPIGEWARDLSARGDRLKGYVADVAGTEIVEAAMDRIHSDLERYAAAEGLRVTNRFSPGYCHWDVAEQRVLFRRFPDGFCGVRLSDSCLMHPTKSVSGVIGIGTGVRNKPYPCKACRDELCIHRERRLAG